MPTGDGSRIPFRDTVNGVARGVYTVLDIAAPGTSPESAGVLLVDVASDTLHSRFRRDLDDLFPEESDILGPLEEDLQGKAREFGGIRLLEWLVDSASGFIRVTDREEVDVEDFPGTLAWLYHRNIRPKVLPFRTHLPVYSLQAAAGKWGPERDVEQDAAEWVEAPADLRLTDDLFVAQVVGGSMEPVIPAGSRCVFRAGVKGSRTHRRVLVVNYGVPGDQRFTVKEYESRVNAEGEKRVILHPLNPDYESWEIDPADSDRVAVIAEFVQVLEA